MPSSIGKATKDTSGSTGIGAAEESTECPESANCMAVVLDMHSKALGHVCGLLPNIQKDTHLWV